MPLKAMPSVHHGTSREKRRKGTAIPVLVARYLTVVPAFAEPVKARTPEEARTPTEQANADYALALQLHQEEQEAAERRRAAAAADGRAGDGQPPPAQIGQPGPPAPSQQDTGGQLWKLVHLSDYGSAGNMSRSSSVLHPAHIVSL